jgi:single-strand DNA-binding protein
MSRSLNNVQLIGNIGNDPEIRTTSGGNKVATFSLATSKQWTGQGGDKQEKTEWHRCVAWNVKGSGLADVVEKYVKKGERIYVGGSIEYGQYKDKEGQTRYTTEIKARDVLLLGGKSDDALAKGPATRKRDADEMPAALDDEDDSLPF